jgi:hypothetical protein
VQEDGSEDPSGLVVSQDEGTDEEHEDKVSDSMINNRFHWSLDVATARAREYPKCITLRVLVHGQCVRHYDARPS